MKPGIYPDLDEAKFWSKVSRDDEGCWLWLGSKTSAGYGNLWVGSGVYGYAHRVSYELEKGPIAAGLVIDHLCRNRACVRPDHLEPVTTRTNVIRGLGPYGLRTTCRHGHDITDPNAVYTDPAGGRRCRRCAEARSAARRSPDWPRTHCPQGHPYDEENTQYEKSGHRRCAECNRQRARRNYYAKKAAR